MNTPFNTPFFAPHPRWLAFAAGALLCVAMGSARADDHGRLNVVPLPKYTAECATCHMGFQPGLLPKASWQRIMKGLDKHYGTDASLDAASVNQISVWLDANAGTSKRVRREGYGVNGGPPDDRITRAAWFDRKHREIAPAVFKRASIKSAANCMACHTRADVGDYDDDNVRIPK